MEDNKELVLRYWNSWQKADFEEMRECLADKFSLSGGGQFKFDDPDKFVEMSKMGNGWRDVTMIDMVAEGNKVSMIYSGTDKVTEVHYRVAEFISVTDGKISDIEAVILRLA